MSALPGRLAYRSAIPTTLCERESAELLNYEVEQHQKSELVQLRFASHVCQRPVSPRWHNARDHQPLTLPRPKLQRLQRLLPRLFLRLLPRLLLMLLPGLPPLVMRQQLKKTKSPRGCHPAKEHPLYDSGICLLSVCKSFFVMQVRRRARLKPFPRLWKLAECVVCGHAPPRAA